jgi:signal transduction histidine kinase
MEELNAGVVVPLKGRDGLLGLLSVKDDRLYEAYSYDEIGRMAEVARQAALTVENSRLYDSIRERDRLAVLGEMSAGLAHEVRNPLGAIKGAAQVLQSRATGEGAQTDPMLDVIVEEVGRLDVVVSRFLDYARPMNVEPAPSDLNDLVERAVKALRASPLAEDIEMEVVTAEDLPAVMADDEMLGSVLVNLGRNALEATGEGGTVTFTTRRFRGRPVGVPASARPELGWAEVRVADDGEGIADEVLKHLFIPFYTTKSGGTGLGLAISQRVVRKLGGTMDVRSRQGKGSTFIVYLQLAPT